MKLLKNKKVVGITTIVLGLIAIGLAIPAIVLYAYPLATSGSASDAMKSAFKHLSLLNEGVDDVKIAMGLGVAALLVGAGAVVWGLILVLLPKLTFKHMITAIVAWVVAGVTALAAVLAAIGLAKGTSKEIKALDGFQDVNTFFEDNYKVPAGDIGGVVYMAAAKNAASSKIAFDPIKAAELGSVREGLIYVGTDGKTYKGLNGIYINGDFTKPKKVVEAEDKIMMANVDGIWTGLGALSTGVPSSADPKLKAVESLKQLNDLMFNTLLGNTKAKEMNLISNKHGGAQLFKGFMDKMAGANIDLAKINDILPKAAKASIKNAPAADILAYMNAAGIKDKKNVALSLAIVGMFTKKTKSLLYKLEWYKDKFGTEAASEGLYLYLARISELSSKDFYLSNGNTDKDTRKPWFAYNQAGRITARALLTASLSDVTVIDPFYKGQKLAKDITTIYNKAKYTKATNTTKHEDVYALFK